MSDQPERPEPSKPGPFTKKSMHRRNGRVFKLVKIHDDQGHTEHVLKEQNPLEGASKFEMEGVKDGMIYLDREDEDAYFEGSDDEGEDGMDLDAWFTEDPDFNGGEEYDPEEVDISDMGEDGDLAPADEEAELLAFFEEEGDDDEPELTLESLQALRQTLGIKKAPAEEGRATKKRRLDQLGEFLLQMDRTAKLRFKDDETIDPTLRAAALRALSAMESAPTPGHQLAILEQWDQERTLPLAPTIMDYEDTAEEVQAPKDLRVKPKARPIRIDARGVPVEVRMPRSRPVEEVQEEVPEESHEEVEEDVPAVAPRSRWETPEERKARKASVKADRRTRRARKKALKMEFKDETGRQVGQRQRERENVQGVALKYF
eukprot:gnl/Dysnectes_brevis/3165_a3948_986.p1 GENE.gnl/Dysnectes_brevis/3165_a3948_986~~gnl/Dysnectes_brevis/3165_a3948_986.p1  ORF type:complete len:374 (-),score=163.74 gnl/Dysnectes_brevis/3165_a3948_986:65-1186(-)